MTKKLYYDQPYLERCAATVTECHKIDGEFEILIDQTVIFPGGGGQPADEGIINAKRILRGREEGGDIWYTVAEEYANNTVVSVELNLERRIGLSQQHTGEHILSGLASKIYDAQNVGFHMAEDYATLDLDVFLDDDKLAHLKKLSNSMAQKNIPVKTLICSPEELSGMTLRKKADGLNGEIRVVSIDGMDSCTCCGTHCATTAEVGIIQIADSVRYKGGTRIWYTCGLRALDDYTKKQDVLKNISGRFSVKTEDAFMAVVRQGEELSLAKREYRAMLGRLMEYECEKYYSAGEEHCGTLLIIFSAEGYDSKEIKQLADMLIAKSPSALVLAFSRTNDTVFYQINAASMVKHSAKELCATVNMLLNGKGGGRDDSAQGSAKYSPSFADSFDQLKSYIVKMLSAKK